MKKKFNLFYLILVFIGLNTLLAANENFYLLPKDADKALGAITKNIDQSKKSIKITIYNFTHKKIAKRLKNAARRGVKVEIIFDERSANEQKKRSMLYYLAKYKNITVYKLKGKISKNRKYHGIMHLKTALFDHRTVLFGSANWSHSAFGKNYELIYLTKEYAIAKKFNKYFDELKKISTKFK
ncbi:MAG: FAM83 family protein [Epsilonproteobacteria bacterium]|nr:FAM83 family protein [Campylobacterota bacterium]